SGGVDSGALAALAAEHSGEPVRTFSIGFEEAGFNELSRARLVAERYGSDHHELIVRPDAVQLLPKLVEAFDEPFGDSSAPPPCRRWSATTPGRRSSRRSCAPSWRGRGWPAGIRSTSTALASPKPRAPSRWRGCRTSTSASISPTTCW